MLRSFCLQLMSLLWILVAHHHFAQGEGLLRVPLTSLIHKVLHQRGSDVLIASHLFYPESTIVQNGSYLEM